MKHILFTAFVFLAGCTTTSKSFGPDGTGGDNVGGDTSGGSAGDNTGGSGGIDTGGSSAGGVAGEAGSGGIAQGGNSGSCSAKTCLTLEVESGNSLCGLHEDGCGNWIDCEGCPDSMECGQEQSPAGWVDIEPNVCGSACLLINQGTICPNWPHINNWACWHPSEPPLGNTCIAGESVSLWCCTD